MRTWMTPEDVDVAQLYDAFTTLIPLSLEGYGFCGRGEGAAFTEEGAIELGGRLPVNTSGAGMSEAYVHGFNLVTEGVRQVRGTSTAQVEGADNCLVTSVTMLVDLEEEGLECLDDALRRVGRSDPTPLSSALVTTKF